MLKVNKLLLNRFKSLLYFNIKEHSTNVLTSKIKIYDKDSLNSLNIKPLLLSPPEKVLCVPPYYPQKNLLSGLVTQTPKELSLLLQKDTLYHKYNVTLLAKAFYHTMKHHNLEDLLGIGLEELHAIFIFTLSKDIQLSMQERTMPLLQHYACYIFGPKEFDYKLLKTICNKSNINCDTFEGHKIKINTFIEVLYAKPFIKYLNKQYGETLQFHLINSEGFNKEKIYFNVIESIAQTGQKHADMLIVSFHDSISGNKYYYDIKSFFGAGFKHNRFSLFISNDKILLKLMNNIVTTLNGYIMQNKNNLKDDITLPKLLQRLKQIQVNDTLKYADRYKKMLDEVTRVLVFNNQYEHLHFSFSLPIENVDTDFQQLFADTISRKVDSLKDFESLQNVFPKSPQIDFDTYKDTIENLVLPLYPPEVKEILVHNWKALVLDNS